ncbi:L-2-amino-thiazoline-4-carboxylic acid hydrolase [Roseomonas sp. OT10]|uniref:L-2-amino-thiazoline-4-carboxylic acid hydrolase n=1 Tax=Roseomonas cutis TaxID=2897332 RepID=UPI001E3EF5AB|nr:L-2-amino-thiazoline-4-carboxylic acid hydrolase [Roseomonas sp. OT10]UFN49595.1 L-2-amino-thiazoline-4-carboxylic acid hydrolase [Roseomonas sp. OT10]
MDDEREIPSPALPAEEPSPEERAARLAAELDAAFKARGRLYWDLYLTLREAHGEAEAERLLAAAIERRGAAAGQALFAGLAAPTPMRVAETFLTRASPDWGRLFPHAIRARTDGTVRVLVRRCPLKEAWEEDGRSEAEIALLCRIAGRADHGVFGASGVGFSAETWVPGEEGCCRLTFAPGSPGGGPGGTAAG